MTDDLPRPMPMSITSRSRIEDAALNASAAPQQLWYDGWLLRLSPGKANRARCINALAPGRLPLAEKLAHCKALYGAARLPLVFRITPFSQPATLDGELEAMGMVRGPDTPTMARTDLNGIEPAALPAGYALQPVDAARFAQAVGELRGTPAPQRAAHAQRLELAPVAYQGVVITGPDGPALACGHAMQEGEWVGLHDVHTAEVYRGLGLAKSVCTYLMWRACQLGARCAYLQVEADNHGARALYRRMGFADAYNYHYRTIPSN